MTHVDSSFIGSIPDIYDSHLVPLIFKSYADDLADRVRALNPQSVLEIAAGSGVVSRAMAAVLPSATSIKITDLNQPMLDHAQKQQATDARYSWTVADAQDLPFESELFDVVVCQFGVMFFPDRAAAYREVLRVLKPGGAFLANVWDDIHLNEFAQTVSDAVAGVFPDNPPQFLPRTPHGYHDQEVIQQEILDAGFSEIRFSRLTARSEAPSPLHAAIAYCQGTPLRNEIEARAPDRLQEITNIAANAIEKRYGSFHVSGKIQGIVLETAK